MNCKEICRNRFLAIIGLIMIIIINIITLIIQGLNWFSILLACFSVIASVFSLLDIFEINIFFCKKKNIEISLKDEAKQDKKCREKRLKMYEILEKGDQEEKELLNAIKMLNKNEQNILKHD